MSPPISPEEWAERRRSAEDDLADGHREDVPDEMVRIIEKALAKGLGWEQVAFLTASIGLAYAEGYKRGYEAGMQRQPGGVAAP